MLGVLQPLAAIVVSVALVPAAVVTLAGGAFWEGARAAWEAVAWRAVSVLSA